jgi:tryptophan synthase beta chain
MSHLDSYPDEKGYFGKFGGSFIPPQLEVPFQEITKAYNEIKKFKSIFR